MSDKYGFNTGSLQPQNDWRDSWGQAKNGFNLDLASGENFGEYMPMTPDYSMGGGPSGSVFSGSNLGSTIMGDGSGGRGSGIFGSLLDKRGADGSMTQGWGGMALGAIGGGINAYLGFKQLGLAKDSLKFNKEQFHKNFDAQRRTTNASMEDRQRARVASNAGAYESVGSYMDKNGIK